MLPGKLKRLDDGYEIATLNHEPSLSHYTFSQDIGTIADYLATLATQSSLDPAERPLTGIDSTLQMRVFCTVWRQTMLLELRRLEVLPWQRLLLRDVTWQEFETILQELGSRAETKIPVTEENGDRSSRRAIVILQKAIESTFVAADNVDRPESHSSQNH
jgi:hypothetical protein